MTVTQIKALLNDLAPQVLGQEALDKIDVTDIGTFGEAIKSAQNGYEMFHNALIDRLYKIIIDMKSFEVEDIPFLADNYRYAGFIEEFYVEMPEAEDTKYWNVADEHFTPTLPQKKPLKLSVKKYIKKPATFEREYTVDEPLVLSAFNGYSEFEAYVSAMALAIENATKIDLMNVARMARLKFMATILSIANTPSKVNILAEYHNETGDNTVTINNWTTSKEFLLFLAEFISRYPKRFATVGSQYINEKTTNNTDYVRQTTKDDLVFEIISEVASKLKYNLKSLIFNQDIVTLPNYHEVLFWQGRGNADGLDNFTSIDVKLGENESHEDIEVKQSGIIGIMYDRNSIIERFREPYRYAIPMPQFRYTNHGVTNTIDYNYKLSYPTVIFVIEDDTNP